MRNVGLLFLLAAAACNREPSPSTTPTATPAAASSAPSVTPAAPGDDALRAPPSAAANLTLASDTLQTSAGPLGITPIHHATLFFSFNGKTIVLDPSSEGLRPDLPLADYVFITDIHPDHLDPKGLDALAKPSAVLVGPPAVDAQLASATKRKLNVVLKNGESHDFGAFHVDAVPMYNEKRGPGPGKLFHDKGRGDGFVFTFGDARVYVSGDTECVPEVRALKDIKVAFMCMNLPYTMPADEAAECVRGFKPKIVYPYHYRGQDLSGFESSVGSAGIEVRVRDWYGVGKGRSP